MELEIRHLKILTTIAEQGSITRAAPILGVSQPSLTAQLRRIEHAMGSPLFERSRGGVQPTAFGRTVLAKARAVLTEMADLRIPQTADAKSGEPTELHLGSLPGPLLPAVLPRIVELYGRGRPSTQRQLEVHAHTDTSMAALLALVHAGRLDVAMIAQTIGFETPVPEGVRTSVIVPLEPIFVAFAEDHALADKDVVELAELAGEHWLIDPQEDRGAAYLRAVCRKAGFEAVIAHEVSDVSTARGFLTSGQCISLAQATSQEGRGIVVRPLAGDPLALRIDLVWTDSCPVDPALVRRAAADAYPALINRNPSFERWWAEHAEHGTDNELT